MHRMRRAAPGAREGAPPGDRWAASARARTLSGVTAATASDRGSRAGALRERLREETREAHAAAERAFDLPRRLASLDAYAEVLHALDDVLRDAAGPLRPATGRLPAGLRDGATRRRARLDADLAQLGRTGWPARTAASAPRPAAPDPDADRSLGAWYVHEGAALGGLVIRGEIRRRLPAALPASTYFAGEGPATAARWRAFAAVLGDWPGDGDRVLDGARAGFAALIRRLEAAA
jgi:heme oxygenase